MVLKRYQTHSLPVTAIDGSRSHPEEHSVALDGTRRYFRVRLHNGRPE